MNLFLDEEDSRPWKMKANVKYNKAFEATKTQFLAQVNNEDFFGPNQNGESVDSTCKKRTSRRC